MMRINIIARCIAILLVFGTMQNHVYAQVLQFTEIDDDGKIINVSGAKQTVIDLNSRIEITIDKNALTTSIAGKGYTGASNVLLKDLKTLNDILTARKTYLEKFAGLLSEYNKEKDPAKQQAVLLKLDEAITPIADMHTRLRQTNPGYKARFSAKLGANGSLSGAEKCALMFETMAEEYDSITGNLEKVLETKQVKIVLGAWLATSNKKTALHLPGFDEYENQKRFVVERWDYTLSPEEKEELKKYEELKKDIDSRQLDVKGKLKDFVTGYISNNEGYTCIKKVFDEEVKDFIGNLPDQTLLDSIESHKEIFSDYAGFLEGLRSKYTSEILPADEGKFFEMIDADVQSLVAQTELLRKSNTDKAGYYATRVESLVNEKKEKLKAIVSQLNICSTKLQGAVSSDITKLQNSISSLINGVQVDVNALEFTDKVKRHSLGGLPIKTELLLENAGVRKPGDKLIFKVGMVTVVDGKETIQDVESRVFNLFMVIPHLRTTVYMAFADPVGGGDEITDKKFVPAPSYSILLKGFDKCIRRKNVFYNRFVDPGIGVHFAYLNFDENSAPELGLGGNISIFRDFLQLGGGYNVGLNVGYWFFGVKFPFMNMTVPLDGQKASWDNF